MNSGNKPKTEEKTRSKYELTLAEFPVFLLSKKGHKDIGAIEYQDTITGKEGEVVKREWKVYPHSKFGLGTESTFETLFELFQVWKENNFNGKYIQFGSIYSLLKRKGKGTGVKEYKRIIRDLNCLVGITIEAKNAFWDNEVRAYVDMTFHLFDRLELFKERSSGPAGMPYSRIKASDILYGSILKNSLLITNFDTKFFQSLTPFEQRLALYLSKIFRSQTVHRREVFEFARQLPIYAQQTKHVKLQLKRGCSGLIDKGFEPLKSFGFERGADRSKEYIVFRGNRVTPAKIKIPGPEQRHKNLLPKSLKALEDLEYLTETILEFCGDQKSLAFYKKVARLVPRNIIFRALSEARVSNDLNETKKSKAAHFTFLIKTYAKEQDLNL